MKKKAEVIPKQVIGQDLIDELDADQLVSEFSLMGHGLFGQLRNIFETTTHKMYQTKNVLTEKLPKSNFVANYLTLKPKLNPAEKFTRIIKKKTDPFGLPLLQKNNDFFVVLFEENPKSMVEYINNNLEYLTKNPQVNILVPKSSINELQKSQQDSQQIKQSPLLQKILDQRLKESDLTYKQARKMSLPFTFQSIKYDSMNNFQDSVKSAILELFIQLGIRIYYVFQHEDTVNDKEALMYSINIALKSAFYASFFIWIKSFTTNIYNDQVYKLMSFLLDHTPFISRFRKSQNLKQKQKVLLFNDMLSQLVSFTLDLYKLRTQQMTQSEFIRKNSQQLFTIGLRYVANSVSGVGGRILQEMVPFLSDSEVQQIILSPLFKYMPKL